jgi:hypothetical protein
VGRGGAGEGCNERGGCPQDYHMHCQPGNSCRRRLPQDPQLRCNCGTAHGLPSRPGKRGQTPGWPPSVHRGSIGLAGERLMGLESGVQCCLFPPPFLVQLLYVFSP